MPFKGGSRTWSNRYFFENGAPSGDTRWHTLMDNVVAAEAPIYTGGITIIECWGYDAGSEVPVSEKAYSTGGSFIQGSNSQRAHGEAAALVRYSTAKRSSKNHPVYLFNYYHWICTKTDTTDRETLTSGQAAAISTYVNHWLSGFTDGSQLHRRCGPDGTLALGVAVEEFATHRDFPYTRSL